MTTNEQALPKQALLPCPFCDQAPNLFRGGPPLARAEWAACYGKKPGFEHEYIAMPLPAWQNPLAHTRPAVSDETGEAALGEHMVSREVALDYWVGAFGGLQPFIDFLKDVAKTANNVEAAREELNRAGHVIELPALAAPGQDEGAGS